MTVKEWNDSPDLAAELNQILNSPVFTAALSIIEANTLAKTVGNGPMLERFADKAHVFFGYDSGRNSVIADLKYLALKQEELTDVQPTYQPE